MQAESAKRIVLAGNPNAGKTTLFNSLSNSNLRTGNFHGVTTSAFEKKVKNITFVDSPGLYSMNAYSMEENSASEEIKSADVIVNVVDCLTLENSLNLTKKIISYGKPTVVYLTKSNRLKKRGGFADCALLSKILGVKVYDCSPKQFKKILAEGESFTVPRENIPLEKAYSAGRCTLTKADRLLYNRFFALGVFLFSVTAMFFVAFHPVMIGAKLKDLVEYLICDLLCSLITSGMKSEPLISLVSEGILGGAGGVLAFIPQLTILYLFLTILDESGITSALAFATDGLFEKVNLSGRTAFSLVSGFGCTAGAILTTKGYSSQYAEKRTIAVLPYIPCGAKLPVFLTFLSPIFENPFPAVCCLYFAGIALCLLFSFLLKKGSEGMLAEVTPVIFPSLSTVFKKLYFYLKGFIIKVAVTVLIFCIVSWVFSHYTFTFEYVNGENSILACISKVILPVFYPMGITDWRIAYASLCGFIAKENVAGAVNMLIPEGISLSLAPSVAMCAFILLCPACISAFSASVKEAGLKFTLKCYVVQTIIAFLGAYLINLLFSL